MRRRFHLLRHSHLDAKRVAILATTTCTSMYLRGGPVSDHGRPRYAVQFRRASRNIGVHPLLDLSILFEVLMIPTETLTQDEYECYAPPA
jgi:hypothetical protein